MLSDEQIVKIAKAYVHGADNSITVTPDEMVELTHASVNDDIEFFRKMAFRVLDRNQDQYLTVSEMISDIKAVVPEFDADAAKSAIKGDEITYSQFMKFAQNLDVPETQEVKSESESKKESESEKKKTESGEKKAESGEKTEEKKSSCCLLL